ncbi:hypothetical protein JCM17844_09110 [Iodidimonas gelatinilytica]|uniref:Uncharacterized protein n=1 Tax=Iodidimonas gelatinilytica TaxID=1236966 RepID=A0A5A7MNR5_9PROT|nr:hypothetical protein JCM17844_09110 [Iodidimonas gelatinilytica]GEQ99601.1 hypothetical protein JCM17845_02250 [Iodidimonas gelatinilytica]
MGEILRIERIGRAIEPTIGADGWVRQCARGSAADGFYRFGGAGNGGFGQFRGMGIAGGFPADTTQTKA